jgi:LacI family transcriptional regulator
LKVPEDVAIFGYDDVPMAFWVPLSQSTCSVDFEEMGREATKLLINKINDGPEVYRNVIMQPRLVIRNSAP